MKRGTVDEVVEKDLCCGCGVCEVGCPTDAISMHMSPDREYQPIVDADICVECPICLGICPFDERNLHNQASEAQAQGPGYGLPENASFFRGFEIDDELFLKSASGGLLSALLVFLLEKGLIDCVLHAEPVFAAGDDLLFRTSLSTTVEEVNSKRSSFYYPIEFSKMLTQVAEDDRIRRICVVAIPCAVSGIDNLARMSKLLKKKIWAKLSLVCGHSVSGQFADMLIQNFPSTEEKRRLNFRNKVDISNSENFNTELELESGKVFRQSRLTNPYTRNWRTYSYAMNACFSCPDFWGVSADASFKDAWGFKDQERVQGESVVVVRNPRLREVFEEMKKQGRVRLQQIDREELLFSQWETVEFKSIDIVRRIGSVVPGGITPRKRQGVLGSLLHDINYRLKRFNMRLSKRLWRRYGLAVPALFSRVLALMMWGLAGAKRVLTKWQGIRLVEGPGLSVLYTAGFGYGNLGDEAQLHSNLDLWRELLPTARVTVLSPRPVYTRQVHGGVEVIPASRTTLWGLLGLDYFALGNSSLFFIPFILKYGAVLINALLVRWLGFTILMSPHSANLLQRLKDADVLHIGGGGYLTGKTPSRLYDYMALMRLARILRTDVILSGHNIGVWRNPLQRWFARNLRSAEIIGLRDNDASLEDLQRIGIKITDQVRPLFDDALFCPPASEEELKTYLSTHGLDRAKGILAVNVHYWILEKARVDRTLDLLARDIAALRDVHGLELVFIPMVRGDQTAIDYLAKRVGGSLHVFKTQDDFRLAISLIQAAQLCITMKHHPIIFAMAGGVPTISIHFEEYYQHKNVGAMKLFGQERFALGHEIIEDNQLSKILEDILKSADEVRDRILNGLKKLEDHKGEIIQDYLRSKLLLGVEGPDSDYLAYNLLKIRGR